MSLSELQNVVGTSFIPDSTGVGILSKKETLHAAERKSPSGLYEVILLVVSFTLLLFGLLPVRPEGSSVGSATREENRNTPPLAS